MPTQALARDALMPRTTGGNGRGIGLSMLVHAGLIVAIAFGVSWRSRTPEAQQAELWAAVPQAAAPRAAVDPAAAAGWGLGGGRADGVHFPVRRRWARMWRTASGSSIRAMISMVLPQRGQIRGSFSYTLRINRARACLAAFRQAVPSPGGSVSGPGAPAAEQDAAGAAASAAAAFRRRPLALLL